MEKFEIVKITENYLLKLADEMYMDPSYLEQVREMMSKDDMVVFAAVNEGRFVGRCSLWLAPQDESELLQEIPSVPMINALEVNPEFYRRGIASQLIRALEEESRRRGKTMLALGVEPQNGPGKALYEKLGFRYHAVLGKETFVSSWLETMPDGTTKKRDIDTLLMVKEV